MLSSHFDPLIVVLSFFLSFISAYNAVALGDIFRNSFHSPLAYSSSNLILIVMSISIGGGAIWSMHFTGMAGLTILGPNNQKIPLHYNIGTTILSLLTAIVCVYCGLYISSRDRVYIKDKEEIFKMLIDDAQSHSIKSIQNRYILYRMAVLKGLGPLIIGGVITGGGVCVMHYIGMGALAANVTIVWDIGLVILSVIIAIVASTAAFWILFRLLPLFTNYESLRLISALIMAIAVCGMHYTGMMAATYRYNNNASDYNVGHKDMTTQTALLSAVVSCICINWIISMLVQSELRQISYHHSRQLNAAQKLLGNLYTKYPNEIPGQNHSNSQGYNLNASTNLITTTKNGNSRQLFSFGNSNAAKVHVISSSNHENNSNHNHNSEQLPSNHEISYDATNESETHQLQPQSQLKQSSNANSNQSISSRYYVPINKNDDDRLNENEKNANDNNLNENQNTNNETKIQIINKQVSENYSIKEYETDLHAADITKNEEFQFKDSIV